MKNNQIDIILPVFNSKKFILKTLQSIFQQSYKNWRLIIVDDASNDGTLELIKNFINNNLIKKKIILIKNKKNKGQAFSRNIALKKSKSPYVAFIDSDDIWEKNKLKKQINFMLKYNYAFTYSNYKTIKKDLIKIIHVPPFFNLKNFIKNTSIATSTMIIKKNIINKIFFPNLRLCEDYYFKCQILKFNYAYRCPSVYSIYTLRSNSLQSARFEAIKAIWSINKNLNNLNFINNLNSVINIIFNSLKKYGFR
jgi:teichuronic acid biosynthesis glycosyltransferase TuaG